MGNASWLAASVLAKPLPGCVAAMMAAAAVGTASEDQKDENRKASLSLK